MLLQWGRADYDAETAYVPWSSMYPCRLQWGRADYDAETAAGTQMVATLYGSLQWGRADYDAETWMLLRAGYFPAELQWGRADYDAETGRGRMRTAGRILCFNGAAPIMTRKPRGCAPARRC